MAESELLANHVTCTTILGLFAARLAVRAD